MNKKYYIATKEDKVGTVFAVAEYVDDTFFEVYTGKMPTNGVEALKDITKWIVDKDNSKNSGISSMMSFKFKTIDDAVHIGNMLDKDDYYKDMRKNNHYVFFSSPAVFLSDAQKMHKAESSLNSYLIMRDYYIKSGKIK